MVRASLGAACVAILAISVSGQGRPTGPPPEEVGLWIQAVERHRPGLADQPAVDAGSWPHERIWGIVIPHITRSVAETWDNRLLKLGAILHTDIALLTLGTSDLRGLNSVSRNRDSVGLGLGRTDPHLDVARELLRNVQPKPNLDPDVAQWYHAVAAWLASKSSLGDLTYHVEQGRKIVALDARFQFDDGCLSESMTAPRIEVLTGSFQRSAFLQSAERSLRRALDLDPEMVDARVRLGRVLSLRGRHDEAAQELARALAATPDRRLRYDVSLFLGRVEELRGNPDAARRAFEQARRLFPLAQSPLVALSLLASSSGDRAAERILAAEMVDLPADGREHDDPWWTYDRCAGRDVERLIEELRRRAEDLAR